MDTFEDYKGRRIRLTDERLEHVFEHAEMKGLKAAMVEAVEAPELVVESRTDSGAHLHYRLLSSSPFGVKWLCVVVKHREDDAFVLTAYLTDRPKKGKQLWPST